MIASPDEADDDAHAAFLAACTNTSSGALSRFSREWGVDFKNKAAMAAAKERYQSLPLLLDPALQALSLRALAAARTSIIDEATPIHFTVWRGGFDVTDGAHVDLTIGEFVQWLSEEAQKIAPKGEGWNVAPIRSSDGRRLNESTVSMTAVNLDCDGRGEWHRLIDLLTQLGVAFAAYQSGGYRPGRPKWHILIFLPREFDVSTAEGETLWKTAYTCARIALGSVGELRGEGFDPACAAPSQPVFICERRAGTDPPREVTWRRGHTIDLGLLVAALPQMPEPAKHVRIERPNLIALDDGRLERIVAELAAATSSVPSGRRSLYFSLTSALLSFGLSGDDAVSVVAEVSAAHGGDERKHVDCVRIARFVAEKSREEDEGASAGALAKNWPHVMRAVEQALPEVVVARRAKLEEQADRFVAALEARRARRNIMGTAPAVATSSAPATDEEIDAVREVARAVLRRKRRRNEGNDEVHVFFLDRIVRGAPLFASAAEAAELRVDVRQVIARVCRVLAWHVPPTTTRSEAVVALMFPSLARTAGASDHLDKWLAAVQERFRAAVEQRRKQQAERQPLVELHREQMRRRWGGSPKRGR